MVETEAIEKLQHRNLKLIFVLFLIYYLFFSVCALFYNQFVSSSSAEVSKSTSTTCPMLWFKRYCNFVISSKFRVLCHLLFSASKRCH